MQQRGQLQRQSHIGEEPALSHRVQLDPGMRPAPGGLPGALKDSGDRGHVTEGSTQRKNQKASRGCPPL